MLGDESKPIGYRVCTSLLYLVFARRAPTSVTRFPETEITR
jgi:hypothetical protein